MAGGRMVVAVQAAEGVARTAVAAYFTLAAVDTLEARVLRAGGHPHRGKWVAARTENLVHRARVRTAIPLTSEAAGQI